MDANKFIKWFGLELQRLIQTTSETDRFTLSRDLVSRVIYSLSRLSKSDRDQVMGILVKSFKSGRIGDYKVPFDIRDEYDTIEAIYATIIEDLEG